MKQLRLLTTLVAAVALLGCAGAGAGTGTTDGGESATNQSDLSFDL